MKQTDLKREAALDAATSAFLVRGFSGTSMDEIASLASVSKQTLYKQFGSKERLFIEIVTRTVDRASVQVQTEMGELTLSHELRDGLYELGQRQLRAALQPEVIQLRRLVIAEAVRFPELGQVFHDRGPGRTMETLTQTLARLAEHGALMITDSATAATQFNWLVMAHPINQVMLLGEKHALTDDQLDQHVRSAVDLFLTAYAANRRRKSKTPHQRSERKRPK